MNDTPIHAGPSGATGSTEPGDAQAFEPGYGKGGVPWFLLLFYLSFLTFFTWYVLEYQLPDFLEQGPGQTSEGK